jgi:ABC-type phosphate transport system substrate-binding protein
VVVSADSVFAVLSVVAGAGGDVNHAIGLYDAKVPGAATDDAAAGVDSKGSSTPVPLVATFAAAVAAA